MNEEHTATANAQLEPYGYVVGDDGRFYRGDRRLGVELSYARRRFQAKSAESGAVLWSGSDVANFVRKFWSATPTKLGGSMSRPGKFEGEGRYAKFFYEIMLDGMADRSVDTVDGVVDIFSVDDDMVEMFPELKSKDHVAFLNSEQGFYEEVEVPDEDEIEEWEEEYARANGDESDDDYPRPTDEDLRESFVISDGRRGGYDVSKPGGKSFGHFSEFDDVIEEIMSLPARDLANIYYVNDHGNIDLLDDKGKIIASWV